MRNRVAILGAGNGGCAMAADLVFRGHEVRLWSRRAETLVPLWEQGGVEAVGVIGEGLAPVSVITNEIGVAIEGADIVIVTTPVSAHEFVIRKAAPQLRPGQTLMLTPGHEVLFVPTLLRRAGVVGVGLCETGALPYTARKVSPGIVNVFHTSRKLLFAAFPAEDTVRLHAQIATLFPNTFAGKNLLETAIQFNNAVLHPAPMVCNAGWIEHSGGQFIFYLEGITPSVGRLIEGVDRERMAIARSLGVRAQPLLENYYETGHTTAHAFEVGTVYQAMRENPPNRTINAPPTLEHRFLDEDVPYGLVPLTELGKLGQVPTPLMDSLISIATALRGVNYRESGMTLDRMCLRDYEMEELIRVLEQGFPST